MAFFAVATDAGVFGWSGIPYEFTNASQLLLGFFSGIVVTDNGGTAFWITCGGYPV